ncbi:MAG TPA: hypothetical protein VD863_06715, partial [Bradyrhizobium sp.]|nr:hypothetical protein [Bradyrhizobium sp.]
VSLESSRAVLVFADYQLLAAMGQLLAYLKTTRPVDAEPLEPKPFLLFPTKLPPILLDLPQPGAPEPINVVPGRVPQNVGSSSMAPTPRALTVAERWPSWTAPLDGKAVALWSLQPNAAMAQAAPTSGGTAMSFAQEMMRLSWPIKPATAE